MNGPGYYLSRLWDSGLMQRIRGVQAKVSAPQPSFFETTEMGAAGTPSPSIPEESRLFSQRYDRRSIIFDVRKMLADNPLLAEAASVFVDTAISKSFSVTVQKSAKRGTSAGIQNKAQRVIDRVTDDSELKKELPSWAKRAMTTGDLFVQVDEFQGRMNRAFAMPTVSMERLSDDRDSFADPLAAFRQVDVNTNETIAFFAQWQIIHGRWDHESGERYGNSQYLQLRKLNKIFQKMVVDMAVRRAVRATLRRFHRVGDEKHPGTWEDVEKYIAINKLNENAGQAEDYYGTANVDVKNLEGDAHLDQIKDVEFMLNVLFPRTGLAKGLIGFGENVSRDILDDQREFLHVKQDGLVDWLCDHILRPIYDLALLMEGINPKAISYTIQFEDRVTETQKLARCELYLEMREGELMSDRQFISRVARYINVDDVDEYIEELKEWRAERLREKQEAMASGLLPKKREDDPADVARSAIQKNTIGKRGNVARFAARRH
jgi:hypothetical protein